MQFLNKGINVSQKWISKIAIALGFLAATAVGILGGIDAALMFPTIKLVIGLIIGSSSCFVNAVSYFYVVSSKDSNSDLTSNPQIIHKNGIGSSSFAMAAMLFIGITFVANFVGMYIGFTVLGGKLNLHWPQALLETPGIFFGVCSAVSGLYFNIKVAHTLWNIIRQQPISTLPESERPLLIEINNSDNRVNSHVTNLRPTLKLQIQNKEDKDIIPIHTESTFHLTKTVQQGPTLFSTRTNLPILPIMIPSGINNQNTSQRANSF